MSRFVCVLRTLFSTQAVVVYFCTYNRCVKNENEKENENVNENENNNKDYDKYTAVMYKYYNCLLNTR